MIDKSKRWCLCIDPQRQANNFIKKWGKENEEGFIATKENDPKLIQALEQSIQFGRWMLLENIGLELDPVLEPVLTQ